MKNIKYISLVLLVVGAVMVITGAYAAVSLAPVVKMKTLADRGGTVFQKSIVVCPIGATKASLAASGCGAFQKASIAYNSGSVLNGKTRLAAGESCCPAGGKRTNETSKAVALKTSSN